MSSQIKKEVQEFPNFPLNVTIKKERVTPERENANKASEDVKPIFAHNEEDSKGSFEPLKTSDEILAEIFQVFNAEPPKIDLDKSPSKHKKSKKAKKKSKKVKKEHDAELPKRKKVKKERKSGDEAADEDGKRRHKKHKRIKIEPPDGVERKPRVKKEKSADRVLEEGEIREEKSSSSKNKIKIKSLVGSITFRKAQQEAEERRKRKKSAAESDFSLSDLEEDESTRRRPHRPIKRERDYDEHWSSHKSYSRDTYSSDRRGYGYRSSRRGSSRDRDRDRRDRDRDRHRRSRSRSGEPSSRLSQDEKKRLLEIARKNAVQMLKNGTLPGVLNLTQETKDKLIQKVKYGGKSVTELTEYCRKLSNGDIGGLSDVSDVDSDAASEKAFHHPFVLKEREPITMNIRNSVPIIPKSAEEKKELLKMFPVSSGQEHRLTENEWVPVTPSEGPLKAIMPPPPAPPKPATVAEIPMPAPPATPGAPLALPAPPLPPTTTEPPTGVPAVINTNTQLTAEMACAWKTNHFGFSGTDAGVADPKSGEVFATIAQGANVDVSQVISNRLDAMRRLQENPADMEASKIIEDTQKTMTAWASSKFTPGQFLGSTGVNILSAKELAGKGNAWAKKDQLITSAPVTSGMGMHLLQKMGWRPGEGLGKDKTGSLQPLLLEVKNDKRGLVSAEEVKSNKAQAKRWRPPHHQPKVQLSVEGKHPVSLLGELASKRKWGAPQYETANEVGPGHAKMFIFKVRINGMEYQPAIASNTKKEAKAVAAKFCLQQMGVLPT